jgi:hypothetical protein
MRRLLWYGNSSGSDRNPNSSDNHLYLSVQLYGTYCQQTMLVASRSLAFVSVSSHLLVAKEGLLSRRSW